MVDLATAFVSGFTQLFAGQTFLLMIVGIAVGFVVGILPGLGGPTTLALMLPFIFKMNAVQAFAFLLGMSAVTNTTGDITSILFGVPGEPTTAATIVDGHPMAKKGEAGRALGAALMSSLIGAAFGALALALAVPVVRPLVLTFGSPEFFMLALVGVAFVASLSGNNLLKGLISGGLGYLLATIGLDPISGIQRYTFGKLFLWDGIGLVPVTIGLFAIPEVIDLAVQGTSISKMTVSKLGGVMEGVRDTFRHFWLVIRCSAIGTYIGLIPGMGGAVSQWVAYAHAVQSSPNKDRFGKGAVEGVLGPGAANNSTLGGALIPTVAFGVPGSVSTAILLGAFIIQGLVPGPDMLMPEPKGHLSLTFSLVWINIVSNLITVAICFLFLNQIAKITNIRAHLLMPFILVLIYVGTFAEKNAFEDLGVFLVFGALGWIMVQVDWQRPPLILGLVLGPVMENRLFLSTDNYGLAWIWRPGVLILFVITLAGIFYPMLKKSREKRLFEDQLATAGEPMQRTRQFRSPTAILFSLFLVLLLIGALWQSRDFGYRAGLFPWAIGFPVLALALVQLGMDFTGKTKFTDTSDLEADAALPQDVRRRRIASIIGWIFAFYIAIWLLGFSLAVPVMIVCYLKIAGKEKWPITILLALLAWGCFYGLFEQTLHVPFPDPLIHIPYLN
ncbi:MAG TPA: tripartite tricarboxylate transporter permease [Verrucomicrobiae bacterium]|nr:tripartite tricarboxylate transporter permease [Verrucomicrobiae bacterium]